MNQGPNRLMDEFAKLMTDAAGVAQSMRREAETVFRSQAERLMAEMDVVRRDDFEAVREMASKARAENEKLAARIDELEKQVEALGRAKSPRSASSPKKN